MAKRIGIQILEEDFEAFKKLMPNDVRLGRTFAEWKERRRGEDLMATGGVQRVLVRPAEFESYCAESRRKPSYYSLEAFTVRKALSKG